MLAQECGYDKKAIRILIRIVFFCICKGDRLILILDKKEELYWIENALYF